MLKTGMEIDLRMWKCLKGEEVIQHIDDIGIIKTKTIGEMSFIYSKLHSEAEPMIYFSTTNELLASVAGSISVYNDIKEDIENGILQIA